MWNDGPGAVAVSRYIHGWDETALTDEQLAEIEAEWIAQKPLNAFYWTGEYTDLCPPCRTARCGSPTRGRAATRRRSPPATRSATRTRRRGATRGSACTASAPIPRAPSSPIEFLDLKLAEASCGNAVSLFYYGCANGDVMAAIEDPVLIEAFGIDDPSILESTNFTPLVTEEQRDAWTAMWERVQAN